MGNAWLGGTAWRELFVLIVNAWALPDLNRWPARAH